MRKIGEVLRLK